MVNLKTGCKTRVARRGEDTGALPSFLITSKKRRRGGALQDLTEVRKRLVGAIASWSAGGLSRFRIGPALS